MKPWMMAVISGAPQLVTQTYTSSQSVVIPFGVSRLESASGEGGDGAPAYSDPPTPGRTGWKVLYDTTYQRRDGGTDKTVSEGAPVFDGSPKPADYCDPTVETPDSTVYSSYTKCYIHVTHQEPDTPGKSYPATTGASSTGFGLTFPGGAGGPASVTSFGPTAVTGGQTYSLVIPAGGFITITYYR